jgi:hypothetical protein
MRRLTWTDSYGNVITLGNPASGKIKYVIESLVGFDAAPVSRFTQKAPYQDGNTHIDTLLNERIITVEGSIYAGRNLTTIMAARRELSQLFNPKSGAGTLLYTYDGGTKTATCTLEGGPVFKNKDAREPFQKFMLTFIGNDPWLYGSPTTVTIASGTNDWVARTLPSSKNWAAVAYGNGVFVAIARGGTSAATSTDGFSWSAQTLPSSSSWISIAFGAGVFVAIAGDGDNVTATSPDGITWTPYSLPSVSYWRAVAFGNGVFVALAEATIAATSPDGVTWTARTMSSSHVWSSVVFGGGLFVAVSTGSSAVAATSPDGVSWTDRALPVAASWASVAYGSGVFVAIDGSGATTNIAASSPNGITWTARTLPSSVVWSGVVFGGGVFVAVSYVGVTSANSPDGITWTSRTLPSSSFWSCVSYGAGVFVALVFNSDESASFLSNATAITIAGDYSVAPVFTINGPVNTPIITNGTQFIMVQRNLLSGESLIIDCSSSRPTVYFRTTAGVLVNDLKNLVLSSTLFQLAKGLNTLTFLCSSASLTYHERYAGV